MAKTIVGLFDTRSEAQRAIEDLVNAGISRNDVSLVSRDTDTIAAPAGTTTATGEVGADADSSASEGAGAGAVGGTVVGGVLGLLVGIGALAIPGIGPVLAAGPLAAAIGSGAAAIGAAAAGAGIGAATGGLLGGLVGAGIPEEDAHYYAEGVRRGGTLVTVNASDEQANQAYDILNRYNAVDIDERGADYRSGGWDRFNEAGEPYAGEGDWEKSSKVGTTGGTLAGAATGAAMGSVAGPVGTVVGGIAGAVTGAGVGAVGDAAGEAAARTTTDTNYDPADHISSSGMTYRDSEPAVTGTTSSTVGVPPVVGDPMLGGALGASSAMPMETYTDTTTDTTTSTTTDVNAGARRRIRTYDSTGAVGTSYGDTAPGEAAGSWDRSSKVGTTGGTVAGAATGAAMGSVAGPVGTVIGGIAGAVVGGGVGAAGDAAGEAAEEDTDTTRMTDYPATGAINAATATTYGDTATDEAAGSWDRSSKVGTTGGTVAGAATGAAMGSVAGPVGTVIGGIAGAVVGGGVGAAGDAAGEAAEEDTDTMRTTDYPATGAINAATATHLDRSDDPVASIDRNAGVVASTGTYVGAVTGRDAVVDGGLLGDNERALTEEERENTKGVTESDGRKGQVDPT